MNESDSMHLKPCKTLLLTVSIVLLLSACGRKGDLYLPDNKSNLVPGNSIDVKAQ